MIFHVVVGDFTTSNDILMTHDLPHLGMISCRIPSLYVISIKRNVEHVKSVSEKVCSSNGFHVRTRSA